MFSVKDVWFMNHKVRLIDNDDEYTAEIYTDYGWYELPWIYPSKTKRRKALWYYCINHIN